MQTIEQARCPLWMDLGSRLLCGTVSAGIFWLVGHWGCDGNTTALGMTLGLLFGLIYGKSAICAVFKAWLWPWVK